jgi:hypothetical protein
MSFLSSCLPPPAAAAVIITRLTTNRAEGVFCVVLESVLVIGLRRVRALISFHCPFFVVWMSLSSIPYLVAFPVLTPPAASGCPPVARYSFLPLT